MTRNHPPASSNNKPARPRGRDLPHTQCARCPLRANPNLRKFSAAELEFVQRFKIAEIEVQAGRVILRDGERAPHLYTVLDGWAIRYKFAGEGRRQVLNFALKGDLIGLQSALFDKMHQTVEALTEVRLCVFDRKRMFELYREHPGLAYDLTWLAAQEKTILGEHLVNIGQRPAIGRLAYIILFLFDRARRAGLTSSNTLEMPITQEDLADAMGLSIVHTNKTLRRMHALGLIEWRRNRLTILDIEQLSHLAEIESVTAQQRPFI
jgi:CRP/FNR family transcriptional regulator